MKVVIVDPTVGNLRSVERAVVAAASHAGLSVGLERSSQPEALRSADKIIFPGQGSFTTVSRLLAQGLGDALREALRLGKPYLGICLGLQLLLSQSEEAPDAPGLGLFPGKVVRIPASTEAKVPHMGWNRLEVGSTLHPALEAAGGDNAWMYFVHSYHAVPDDPSVTQASVSHGTTRVTAAMARDNILACQFHPEKSQHAGLALLSEFLRL